MGNSFATPPYGDPNQPYDKLPGTLETYHVKWAKPYAGGKLRVLFIVPYYNSREVVEAAQRLEIDYTVIMNVSNNQWEKGAGEGIGATQLGEIEGKVILKELVDQRLNMGHRYDVIVIAKISWEVLPENVRNALAGDFD